MILISEDIWLAAIYEWNKLINRLAYIKWVQTILKRYRDVIKNRGFSIKW